MFKDVICPTPEKVKAFSKKFVLKVSCGSYHVV
jgi:hypothetical protein